MIGGRKALNLALLKKAVLISYTWLFVYKNVHSYKEGIHVLPEKLSMFCYLGDMFDCEGWAERAVRHRICVAWCKWRELKSLLSNRSILLRHRARAYYDWALVKIVSIWAHREKRGWLPATAPAGRPPAFRIFDWLLCRQLLSNRPGVCAFW